MIDVDATNAALDGTGWTVAVEDDPDVPALTSGGDAQDNPGRIVASSDVDVLHLSPNYTDEEIVAFIDEHRTLVAHDAGAHADPVFGCPTCQALR